MTQVEPLPYSQAPLYVRLKEALRETLSSGLQPGDRFPSESEIEARYGVSRTTVRLALGALADEGLIVRRQGKGNIVATPKRSIPDFGLLCERRLVDGGMRIVNIEAVTLDMHRAGLLGIGRSDRAHRVRLVHLMDGAPVCYQVSYLAERAFPVSPTESDVLSGRIAERVDCQSGGVVPEAVEVVLADAFRAQLLAVPIGSPLLLVEHVGMRADGIPVELSRSFYGGHAVRLQMAARTAAGQHAAFSQASGLS